MAEATAKFTPKKRPKSCMQSSDDGSDSTVEDLCRKKFKPIAPKPFLKKDSHQSVLTTVLPVKQPPSSDTKDISLTGASTITKSSSTTSSKYGDLPSMPVMYGGPVFIPVRFPFPVLVPAMFNINGNQQQKCTCYPQKETSNKANPPEGVEPSLSKAESVPQQPCPLHYSFNSNQPTYINHPIPNVQSSFMPVYMGSGGSMQTKGDWPGKPKYSRYKYSMLKNGDIYKGLASNIQSYQDTQVPVSSSQVPGQYLSFTSQANQYSNQNCLSKEKSESQSVSCGEAPCFSGSCSIPCSAPSKCDTMCQTASVQNSSAPPLGPGVQQEASNAPVHTKSVGVDAAVQTDSQEVEAADSISTKSLASNTDVRVTNSSSVQCTLSSGQRGFAVPTSVSYHSPAATTSTGGTSVTAQVGIMGPINSGSTGDTGVPSSSQRSNNTTPSASSSTSLSTTSYSEYPSPNRSVESIRQSGTVSSQGSVSSIIPPLSTVSERLQHVTNDERTKSSFADTPTTRVPGSSFTSRSEVSTSSEALQQRNYETDVIVPLRAAPSPSDAHDVEDMDRFVLSPVISESDNEDMFSRNLPSASTFYRPLRHDRHLGGTVPGPSSSLPRHSVAAVNPVRASSLPPSGMGNSRTMHLSDIPGPAHLPNPWAPPFSQSVQSHERQIHNNVYASSASSSSAGHGLLGTRSGAPTGIEHSGPHPGFHSITPYPPTSSGSNSLFCPPNPFSKQPHSGVPQPPGRTISDSHQYPLSRMSSVHSMPSSSFPSSEDQSSAHSGGTAQFSSSRLSEPTRHDEHYSSLHRNRSALPQPGVAATSGGDKQGNQAAENSDQNRRARDSQGEKSDFENRPGSSGDTQGRLRDSHGSVQSVPLQSNIVGNRDESVQRNMRKDVGSLPYTSKGTSSSQRSFEAPHVSLSHSSNRANILGINEDRNAGSLTQSAALQQHHRQDLVPSVGPHSNQSVNRGVPSSSSGYPLSYVPPLVCRSSVPPMPVHDTPSHHVHGFPPRPMSGTGMSMHGSVTPGLPPGHSHTTHPHPFQPGGTYHGQHNHMFYPHYGSLHQPLSMSPSPAPSHSDLSLLSPRSCTHLHLHGNMLHSPQMPSSVHNFQRPPGFAGGLHAGSYPYSVMEDRLDTCCSGRLGHSPPTDDRSIPALLTNILHRRPGAFSHLEQTASAERNKPSEGRAPSQPSTATSTVTLSTTTVSSVITSNVQTRPSPSSLPRNTLPTGNNSVVSPAPTTPLVQQKSVTSPGLSSSASRPTPSSSVSSLPPRTTPLASASTSSRRVIPPSPTSATSPVVPQTRASTQPTLSAPRSSQQSVPTASPSSVSEMSPVASSPFQNRPPTRSGTGNNSDKYLPVEAVPPSPAPSGASAPTPDSNRQNSDQVVKYGETILKCSRQILRESGRTVLCCWNCDYHTAEPRKMHRHQKKENQPQKCQLCDFRSDTRCKVNQHYKEVHMDKDDPFSLNS